MPPKSAIDVRSAMMKVTTRLGKCARATKNFKTAVLFRPASLGASCLDRPLVGKLQQRHSKVLLWS